MDNNMQNSNVELKDGSEVNQVVSQSQPVPQMEEQPVTIEVNKDLNLEKKGQTLFWISLVNVIIMIVCVLLSFVAIGAVLGSVLWPACLIANVVLMIMSLKVKQTQYGQYACIITIIVFIIGCIYLAISVLIILVWLVVLLVFVFISVILVPLGIWAAN